MENKREVKENDTLLEMDNLNSNNDVGHSAHAKRPGTETNRLTEDRVGNEQEYNDNNSALDVDIGDDDSCDSSSTDEDEDSHSLDPNSCKGKMATVMKSNVMQYCVISMVIADCLIIVLELLIDMDFIVLPEDDQKPSHHTTDASHFYTNNSSNLTTHHPGHELSHGHNYSWHNSSHHDSSNHTEHGAHHHTNKEKAEHILHACSLTILSLFMIEVSLKIYVEGRHLLRQKAEVFDAVVVIVSFTLDIVFSFVSVESAAKDAAGLMVILRLWRVTRIINGVILSLKIEAKKKTDALKKIIRQLERVNKKQRTRIERLEKENIILKQQLIEQNDDSAAKVKALLLKVSHGHHHHHHHDHSDHSPLVSHGHKDAYHKDDHSHKKENDHKKDNHKDDHGHETEPHKDDHKESHKLL